MPLSESKRDEKSGLECNLAVDDARRTPPAGIPESFSG